MNFEDEIDLLESLLGNLEAARIDALETEYHQHLASSLELDIADVQARLDELYELQNECWSKEQKEQEFLYRESAL